MKAAALLVLLGGLTIANFWSWMGGFHRPDSESVAGVSAIAFLVLLVLSVRRTINAAVDSRVKRLGDRAGSPPAA